MAIASVNCPIIMIIIWGTYLQVDCVSPLPTIIIILILIILIMIIT